jgi:ribonuclease BN (tRNA processing enzyme)
MSLPEVPFILGTVSWLLQRGPKKNIRTSYQLQAAVLLTLQFAMLIVNGWKVGNILIERRLVPSRCNKHHGNREGEISVNITLLPSSLGLNKEVSMQYLTSFLINESLVLDAGSLGFVMSPEEQVHVNDILISHTHIDHLASLPLFLETVFGLHPNPVTVYASQTVLDSLQTDLFNGRLWPDFLRMSVRGRPFVTVVPLTPLVTVEIAGLRVTPVPVDHLVPTLGFIVEDSQSTVVFSSDTGPTDAIWQLANAKTNLKAIFLEVSFPNAEQPLALLSKHHSSASFGQETQKIQHSVPFYAYHIKPRHVTRVISELQALGLPNVHVAKPGTTYTF